MTKKNTGGSSSYLYLDSSGFTHLPNLLALKVPTSFAKEAQCPLQSCCSLSETFCCPLMSPQPLSFPHIFPCDLPLFIEAHCPGFVRNPVETEASLMRSASYGGSFAVWGWNFGPPIDQLSAEKGFQLEVEDLPFPMV